MDSSVPILLMKQFSRLEPLYQWGLTLMTLRRETKKNIETKWKRGNWFKEIDNMQMFVKKPILKNVRRYNATSSPSWKVEVHLVQDPPPGDWTGY